MCSLQEIDLLFCLAVDVLHEIDLLFRLAVDIHLAFAFYFKVPGIHTLTALSYSCFRKSWIENDEML